MTHNLKVLGLALCAAFALSAAAASAHQFKSSEPNEAHLTARQYTEGSTRNIHGEESKGTQEFQATTGDKRILKCNEVAAKGAFKSPAEEITATNVEYKNCGAWETNEGKTVKVSNTFVEFTSCDYLFKSSTEETSSPPLGTGGSHAKVKIKCNTPGDHIHIKATELKFPCITIPEQEVGGIRYFKDPKDENKIVIHATTHGIKSTTTNSIACPANPVVHEDLTKGGTYTGEITVEAFKDEAHTQPATLEASEAKKTSEGG
jgi:hypothetical protein